MSDSLAKFCASLGFPLKNQRWSWCAIDEENKKVVLTIWRDRLIEPTRDRADFSWANDASRTDHGANEFRKALRFVLDQNFQAFGIICTAKDIEAENRVRKSFEKELVVLAIHEQGNEIFASLMGRIAAASVRDRLSAFEDFEQSRDAIDDLGFDDQNDLHRIAYSGARFRRDQRVRELVIRRAQGKCEYCKIEGFRKGDGLLYLETHHIISLSNQGPDSIYNVIALCANHHREAHFGSTALELERAFLAILSPKRFGQ